MHTKKILFSILHTHFYKTPTLVYLLYTLFYINNIFLFYFSLTLKLSASLFSLTHKSPLNLCLSLIPQSLCISNPSSLSFSDPFTLSPLSFLSFLSSNTHTLYFGSLSSNFKCFATIGFVFDFDFGFGLWVFSWWFNFELMFCGFWVERVWFSLCFGFPLF